MKKMLIAVILILIVANILGFLTMFNIARAALLTKLETPFSEKDETIVITINNSNLLDVTEELANHVWKVYGEHLKVKAYDPGFYAWGVQYEIRALLNLYLLTGNKTWLEKALERIDFLINYSDVNGDGVPSWGNYNETYGSPGYEYYEWSVWDGLISFSILRACLMILNNEELRSNSTLYFKAISYLNLVKSVIDSWHSCWTEVSPEMGYYWTTKQADIHGPVMNQFSALGLTELLLYDITNDTKYLLRPTAMARYLKKNLSFMNKAKAYTWTYSAYGNIEDISHGAIEVRFMVMCYERGIVFTKDDMEFLANTYKRLIWRGELEFPKLNTYIGGGLSTDYSSNARGWTLLSRYSPLVWLYQVLNYCEIIRRKKGSSACFVLGLTELLLYRQYLRDLAEDALKECKERYDALDYLSKKLVNLLGGHLVKKAKEDFLNAKYMGSLTSSRHFLELIRKSIFISMLLSIIVALNTALIAYIILQGIGSSREDLRPV